MDMISLKQKQTISLSDLTLDFKPICGGVVVLLTSQMHLVKRNT